MNLYKLGLPNSEQFSIKEIGNKILIHRKEARVEWNEHNKYFRSSLWHKETGQLLSAGFRAFVNYGEQPDFESLGDNSKFKAIVKCDGSLLILSSHNKELIIRTRGTVDATKLENGHEIEYLKNKYPKLFSDYFVTSEKFTLLFEWTTLSNRIVLKESEEPTLWLIGIVDNDTYEYLSQDFLDFHAKTLGVERPKTYTFDTNDVELLKKEIEPLQNIEGVVVYDETGQILKKIKTLRYLELHRVFTGIKSVNHLFDLFVEYGCSNRENFETLLATNYDWELVTTLKELLDELYAKWNLIKNRVFWIEMYLRNPDFIELDRKGKAQKILELFPDCSGIAFALLDNKEITPQKLWNTFNG